MMGKTNSLVLLLLATLGPAFVAAFTTLPSRPALTKTIIRRSTCDIRVGILKGPNYNKVVDGIMKTKGLSREDAEKDYNAYLENPTNYALNKGEAYYKNLGYKSLMEGVIGEAEKEGRGDEVKERIAAFKKKSQIKAFSVLAVGFSAFLYAKLTYVPEIPLN